MIHEYALEPELVVTWGDLTLCGHFIDQFGFNRDGEVTGRVVAQYPEDWDRKVRDTLREIPLTPLQKTRVVELLNYIMKKNNQKSSALMLLYFGILKNHGLKMLKRRTFVVLSTRFLPATIEEKTQA